jgi:hypothetical protein
MIQDLLFAIRLFRRRAGLLGLTVGGLALAIGVATTVLSVVSAVTTQGTGFSEPDRVFRIASIAGATDRADLTGRSRIFGEWTYPHDVRLAADVPSMQMVAAHMSQTDARPGARAIVVSEGFWRNALGADPAIVGTPLVVAEDTYTIVGVAHRRHGKSIVLVAVAVLATVLPSRRAAHVDPAQLLKQG